ncbi:type IV secretory system conjugative DNA transfer family protein [Belnapia rosea]|uniref:type IV secretory system conjugative DNA transfer family protein n=1 Tax=Belnapia rosea TaxID=938405 RepID=UPI0008865CFE|nr:type IV secretory system conjugative DNA transfer family protein [Belnapia rosea]SDB71527.1 defect in organelle trafficking protein DotC [Belnapia rosea]
MSDRHTLRATLLCATVLTGLAAAAPARAGSAGDGTSDAPVPPMPSAEQVDRGSRIMARGINVPVTGASITGRVTGGGRPPSLEAMQALRPATLADKGAEGMRMQAVCQEGKAYGARGGLSARSYGINEMLRRHEPELDARYDFSTVAISTGGRTTMLLPPVVTEAQMAFALGDGGQVARETGRIYRITRQGRLTSTVPDWRSYLVRQWGAPTPPAETLRPRTDREADTWARCVADGWAEGELLAVDTFMSDLATLETDLIGMARFHVLLRSGLVEQPRIAVRHLRVQGGGDRLNLQDTTISITRQRGLNPNAGQWRPTAGIEADGPIGSIGR